MNPGLNRDQLIELKELLADRMVDDMSTGDLVEYVLDDLFNYFDKLDEHEFYEECQNYWEDGFSEIIKDIKS